LIQKFIKYMKLNKLYNFKFTIKICLPSFWFLKLFSEMPA